MICSDIHMVVTRIQALSQVMVYILEGTNDSCPGNAATG